MTVAKDYTMSASPNSLTLEGPDPSGHKEPWADNYAEWLLPSVEEINRLADELEKVIKEARDERPVQEFFERNRGLLVQLVHGGHGRWVFPKARLGSEYVTDFMICEKDSGGYHWHLIELENPNYKALTKKGQPSEKLTGAIKQVSDWRIWLRKNRQYAQDELGYDGLDSEFRATIVIGCRKDRSAKDQERYRELSQGRIEIMSYDRLFDRVTSLARGFRKSWDDRLASDDVSDST